MLVAPKPHPFADFLALLFGPKNPVEALRILPLSVSFGIYASVLMVISAMGTTGSWIVTGVCFAIVAVMWIAAYVTKGWVPNRPMKKCR